MEQTFIPVEKWYCEEEPFFAWFIQSGYVGHYIYIYEDPFAGVETKLISYEEKEQLVKQWKEAYTNIENEEVS